MVNRAGVSARTLKGKTNFKKWLQRRGLSIAEVSRRTGLDYMTVARWSSGINKEPRRVYRERLKKHYPDCPLASD